MTSEHEIIVVGGGHNGLVAAAYLAKAGLDVLVVERQAKCGGGVLTEELTVPGFRHDVFSSDHALIQANPLIAQDELGLKSKYGLKYLTHSPGTAFVFPDDRALILYDELDKTCESIAQFSRRDSETYPKFIEACREMEAILALYMFSPPPAFGSMISFLEASERGREYLRLILSSALEVAEDWFESEEVRAALVRSVSEVLIPPHQQGTGNFVFKFAPAAGGVVIPEGGSGALTQALLRYLHDAGAGILTESPVKAIKIDSGDARGVVLGTGEEILATKAVVSSVHVRQLLLEMLPNSAVPSRLRQSLLHIRPSVFVTMKQDLALSEAPRFNAGGDVDRALFVRLTRPMKEMLRMYDDFRYGVPQTKDLGIGTPTRADSSRAPEGKHVLFIWQHEPYRLDGGASEWDSRKAEIADGALDTLRKHTKNLGPEAILGRFVRTPLDLERCNPTWTGGDGNHIGVSLSQLFSNRPLPGWGHYRTPINRLYMAGASTHPGPGVSGGGRAAALRVMEDLKINVRKALEK
ncbi:MAG: NAD(P)/FAD-dependent oxidoreductase [Actinobacteria bacterium]|nr:NAD(P)/FAD-dependent oxidoreductase [Actinomycetota bacterium]